MKWRPLLLSLLVLVFFHLPPDDTGTIRVVTDKLLPTQGEKLRVTGRMLAMEIGAERWVVLREKSDKGG